MNSDESIRLNAENFGPLECRRKAASMSNAERQRTYRQRAKEKASAATANTLGETSTTVLMLYLTDALVHLEKEDDYLHRARAERALHQLARRYNLNVAVL